jgi:hypothetical protein
MKMKVKLELKYDDQETYWARDVMMRLTSGRQQTKWIPCSEFEEIWDKIPAIEKEQAIEIESEHFKEACLYVPTSRLSDFFSDELSIKISRDPRMKGFSIEKIQPAFQRFFHSDARSEYYYPEDAIDTVLEEMMQSFIEDCVSPDIETIVEYDEAAEKLALAVPGLQPYRPKQAWQFPRWIDGGEGVGYRVPVSQEDA